MFSFVFLCVGFLFLFVFVFVFPCRRDPEHFGENLNTSASDESTLDSTNTKYWYHLTVTSTHTHSQKKSHHDIEERLNSRIKTVNSLQNEGQTGEVSCSSNSAASLLCVLTCSDSTWYGPSFPQCDTSFRHWCNVAPSSQ